MKKLLWLASWYPNATDPFSGDFIKRQAQAVSIHLPLKIIFAGKYLPDPLHHKPTVGYGPGNLQEYILYYPASARDNVISKYRSLFTYFKKHVAVIRQLRKNNELPDIVHVQVAMKAGLIALYLKWKYKIPYVLTEHWSGYYPQARDSLFKKSFLDRYLTRLILKHTARLLPVSEALGNQITQHWVRIPFKKIPNVVDTRFFFPSETTLRTRFRFIHISSLLYPKNPEGIIRSFTELLNDGFEAELLLVGPLNPSLEALIKASGMTSGKIRSTGEISYEQVGVELRTASALILFSFYENMPCVILESLCSGVPVIATRVGGIPEVIGDENGILIGPGDERELLEAMKTMILQHDRFNLQKISRQATEQFSYDTVGKKILRVYDEVLGNK
jgi:glycosyltransferase involved in cell wall biosynthesis